MFPTPSTKSSGTSPSGSRSRSTGFKALRPHSPTSPPTASPRRQRPPPRPGSSSAAASSKPPNRPQPAPGTPADSTSPFAAPPVPARPFASCRSAISSSVWLPTTPTTSAASSSCASSIRHGLQPRAATLGKRACFASAKLDKPAVRRPCQFGKHWIYRTGGILEVQT